MTRIKDIEGEFKLIDRVTRRGGAVVGVGDDAAVLAYTKGRYLLFTTDMLCEDDHFKREWYTPRQIGLKAMESNVSDIAAMGGLPTYAVISLSLAPETTVEFIEGFYKGLYESADRHKVKIVGGDMTHASIMVVNVALLGEVEKSMLCLRSGARVGDLICVTGDLGKSQAGLELLKSGAVGNVTGHLEPKCRLKEARKIAKYANAMIDVSDGLASEVNHICEMSKSGAIIFKDLIPLSKATRKSAKTLGIDPYQWALSGGEDYELVFTIPPQDLKRIRIDCPISVVGKILQKKKGMTIYDGRERKPLKGGYDHFK